MRSVGGGARVRVTSLRGRRVRGVAADFVVRGSHSQLEERAMFVALAVILLLAWALGFGVFHVAGGLIHLLIILAVISVIVHFARGRSAV
jgi:hypothetical protein